MRNIIRMNKRKIGILTDSGSDYTDERAEDIGVSVIRMPLMIDNQEFIENDTISDAKVIDYLNQGSIVKTSQPLMGNLVKKIDEMLTTYETVLFIPISSGLSGTYATACGLANQYAGRLVVVDSKTVCGIAQYAIECALQMIDNGVPVEEIKRRLEQETKYSAILLPKDLTTLKRGGRVSSGVAALGNLLKIIPLLKVEDGVIDAYDKVRTSKKAYARAIEYVASIEPKDDYIFMLIYVEDVKELALQQAKLLEEATGCPVRIEKFRSIIFSHTGPGTIGVGYIKKYNVNSD